MTIGVGLGMRVAPGMLIAAAMMVAAPSFAAAPNLSSLPQTCQDTIAAINGDKPQYASLGATMTRARKAKDTEGFCNAARQIVRLIKGEDYKLDYCVGDLANAKDVPPGLSNQLIGIKGQFKKMLEDAKVEKNDRFKCGLANE